MRIVVGSKNPNKFNAVKEAFAMFSQFEGAEFTFVGAASDVADQPIGHEETVKGAKNRSKNAFQTSGISVGLESGLVRVPQTSTGYMNLTICSIYDSTNYFIGSGPGFELPSVITRLVVDEGLELDDAILKSGMTDNPRIGYSDGIIGIMTGGIVTRKAYMVPAVTMALAGYLSKNTVNQNVR